MLSYFVFSPGVMVWRKDEITPREKAKKRKRPREITNRRNNVRRRDEITKRRQAKRRKIRV